LFVLPEGGAPTINIDRGQLSIFQMSLVDEQPPVIAQDLKKKKEKRNSWLCLAAPTLLPPQQSILPQAAETWGTTLPLGMCSHFVQLC
jgi:hypothetical protein